MEADLGEPDSLEPALEGVREVYYLVHSMEPGVEGGFAERDRQAAQNFCEIACKCGVQRTIYLGGVTGSGEQSEHVSSRNEGGESTACSPSQSMTSSRLWSPPVT